MPLTLLYLGGALEKAGYRSRLLDMRVERYNDIDLGEADCVGISAQTGHQILYGLEFAKYVREKDPDIPIIWGGVHPTMLPEETAQNEYVDIVVRGEGEATLVELVQKIKAGDPLESVRGITYRIKDQIRTNPDREFIDLNTLPIDLPYDSLKLDKYPLIKQGRLPVHTSRGCPHRCGFCYTTFFHKRRYRYKTPERVLDEIEYLLGKFHLKSVSFEGEDEFFIIKKRVQEICQGLIERKIDVGWWSFCRFDHFSKFDRDFIKLLDKSGCSELTFGGESGSQRLLDLMQKDITPDMMIITVEKLNGFRILPIVSFMCGIPTETIEDLELTFQIIERLFETNSKVTCNAISIYTPFPGTPMYYLAIQHGFNPPTTLEDWGNFEFRRFRAPWFDKKYVSLLETLNTLTRFWLTYSDEHDVPGPLRLEYGKFPYSIAYKILAFSARRRFKHRFFRFPIEWRLVDRWLELVRGYF